MLAYWELLLLYNPAGGSQRYERCSSWCSCLNEKKKMLRELVFLSELHFTHRQSRRFSVTMVTVLQAFIDTVGLKCPRKCLLVLMWNVFRTSLLLGECLWKLSISLRDLVFLQSCNSVLLFLYRVWVFRAFPVGMLSLPSLLTSSVLSRPAWTSGNMISCRVVNWRTGHQLQRALPLRLHMKLCATSLKTASRKTSQQVGKRLYSSRLFVFKRRACATQFLMIVRGFIFFASICTKSSHSPTSGFWKKKRGVGVACEQMFSLRQDPYASAQLRWHIWPTFPLNFFMKFSQKMPLYFFYTMVQKSKKWPKTQIKGGPALNLRKQRMSRKDSKC